MRNQLKDGRLNRLVAPLTVARENAIGLIADVADLASKSLGFDLQRTMAASFGRPAAAGSSTGLVQA
ncbi:MAG TPA: hypothetical protein VFE79_19820 [Paraburkholderia sp.]|nr:hypothetical protein [Paraburkholderia sp.]